MTEFQDRLQRALDADFRIDRELGGAGMSRVFVATERALNRTVVVKVLPPELAAGVNVERFRREIQLAAQLQHPHIVPLLAAGDDRGLLWFSMPYIEGESLRGVLDRRGRLSPRDVVRILHDVVDALAYAHARGVVHRDIKPDNILTSGMHALVTDFGVAKALSAASPVHGGTTTGMAIGTPAYMAPEQLAADPAMDHRVDLYAVGLLAYELLTGRGPFSGPSPQATLAAQLTTMPEPPHGSHGDIPVPLSLLIMHCLEKEAAKRPQTAQALLAELEALPPLSGAVVSGQPTRRRRAGALMLMGGLTAVAAVGWAVTHRSAPPAADVEALDARDAGPGGDVTARLRLPSGGNADSVARPGAAGDTVPVYRDMTDAAGETVVPFVITRAESLAIAAAVLRRQDTPAASSGGDGRSSGMNRSILLAEVGRIFADSMARAIAAMEASLTTVPRGVRLPAPTEAQDSTGGSAGGTGGGALSSPGSITFDARSAPRPTAFMAPLMAPPADGRVRVVVTAFTNATGRRELSGIARDAAQQLRDAIPTDRFDVVSADVVERATRSLPDRMSVGWALRADFVVSGWILEHGDSVSTVTTLTDVRGGRFSRALETVAPSNGMSMEAARRQMSVWLDTAASIAARRQAAERARR